LIKGLFLYLKDKEFYIENETLKNIGNIKDLYKIIKKHNIKLVHIIDIDLNKGKMKNFDVYDNLTTFIHTQVETNNIEHAIKLQNINVRVVLLPPFKGLDKLKKSFLAVRIEEISYINIIENVNDVVTSNKNIADIALSKGKRLFFIGTHEKAFCNIMKTF